MRILHLNHHGSYVGGVEGYIADVTRSLEAEGHPSHLLYFEPDGPGDLIPHSTCAPVPPWPESAVQATRLLDQVIAQFRPDVAFLHVVPHPAVMEWVAQRLPTVAYVHGPYPVCPGSAQYLRQSAQVCTRAAGRGCLLMAQIERCCWGRDPRKHWRALSRVRAFVAAYNQLAEILVGSVYMGQLLSRGSITSPAISILPPVLIQEPAPIEQLPRGSSTVLFAGRLIPEKGLRCLIEALALIEDDWLLVVAGDGAERGPCEHLVAQLGVSERVQFAGWLNPSEMAAALRTCAVVALPSLWPEPFGRLGPEAFLAARPVVAFAVGGIPDWLEDGVSGFLVRPGDVEELARRIEMLLRSPDLRARMGAQARSMALSRWNASSHVERLVSTFERVREAGGP